MNKNIEKLKNGLLVSTISLPDAFSTTLMVIIKSGPFFDPKNRPGLSHFIEHMIFRGSKLFPSSKIISNYLENNGSEYGAFSYYENNCYWIKSSKENLFKSINILFDQIQNSLFNDYEIIQEKKIIIDEYKILQSNPESLIWEAWTENIWQKTTLGRNYIGNIKSINNITKNDIYQFIKQYYTKDRILYVLSGNFEEKTTLKYLEKKFLKTKQNQKHIYEKLKTNRISPIKLIRYKSENIYVAYGFLTCKFSNKDCLALELISYILGQGWGSILKQKISENGLSYDIQTYTKNLSETGYFLIKFTTNKKNINKIIKIINSQIKIIKKGEILDHDIKRGKNYFIGSLLFNNETSYDLANWYGYQEIINPNKTISVAQKIKLINKISKKKIIEMVCKYFTNDNWYMSLVGDLSKSDIKINFD